MIEKIKKAGIIGEGKMGTNLFYYLLDFGFELRWLCSREAPVEKITRAFQKKINRALDSGIIDQQRFARLQDSTRIGISIDLMSDCDLVIEAISEDLPLKKMLFRDLKEVVSGTCILASNSSSISPSRLSDSVEIKNRLIGLHFFYPIALKNMVEFIVADETSEDVVASIIGFLSVINREFIFLKEKDAFILNKIFLDFQNEAYLIVSEEKLEYKQVDCLIKKHLFQAGAFDFCDSVGLDIMLRSVENYTAEYKNREDYFQFTDALRQMVGQNRLGIKTGSGFYSYPLHPADADHILEGMEPVLSERVLNRLKVAVKRAIGKFANVSGIDQQILRNALEEYIGSDINF
jgi:3-hydroxybutyryl-CoA dehydrogenase